MTLDQHHFETIIVSQQNKTCQIRFNRPEAGNAINAQMVDEFDAVLTYCAQEKHGITVVCLSGNSDVFCAGGDFNAAAKGQKAPDADKLFGIWHQMAAGPFITLSQIEGRVNAGGLGFVAASDIVLAGPLATFGLSEMLFGLFPACVLPFLVRRIGRQKAHYMTLMTKTIDAKEASRWHLVDDLADNTPTLLRQHLVRLQRLDKNAVAAYKSYMYAMQDDLKAAREPAVIANQRMFNDEKIQANIKRYVEDLKFPWDD